jgi:hypothetical protein
MSVLNGLWQSSIKGFDWPKDFLGIGDHEVSLVPGDNTSNSLARFQLRCEGISPVEKDHASIRRDGDNRVSIPSSRLSSLEYESPTNDGSGLILTLVNQL